MGKNRISKDERSSKNGREIFVRENEFAAAFVNAMWLGNISRAELLRALTTLDPQAQRALYFRFWYAQTEAEIGKRLRMSEIAVSELIEEALEKLRLVLTKLAQNSAKSGSAA